MGSVGLEKKNNNNNKINLKAKLAKKYSNKINPKTKQKIQQ